MNTAPVNDTTDPLLHPAFATREEQDEYFRQQWEARQRAKQRKAAQFKPAANEPPTLELNLSSSAIQALLWIDRLGRLGGWLFRCVRNLFAIFTLIVLFALFVGYMSA